MLSKLQLNRCAIAEKKGLNLSSVCYKLKFSLLQTQIQFVTNLNRVCHKLNFNFLETQLQFLRFQFFNTLDFV